MANIKITEMAEDTNPSLNDYVTTVDRSANPIVNKKATINNMLKLGVEPNPGDTLVYNGTTGQWNKQERSAFKVGLSSTYTVQSTVSKVPFNNASVTYVDDFDTSSYHYVVPVTGLYFFGLNTFSDNALAGDYTTWGYISRTDVNGNILETLATQQTRTSSNKYAPELNFSTIHQLNAGDYVAAFMRQEAGTVTLVASLSINHFYGYLINKNF